MRVLVTGGAGFIGSHLVERLVSVGHDVVVFDNEATGRVDNVHASTTYVRGDVSDAADVARAFSGGLDAVCHIAGQVSLIRSFKDPVGDLRTNVQGTVNVISACLQHAVPRLLYASSMTVYGRNGALPTPEDTPCEPISYYGITKYAAERYVHTTAERDDLSFPFAVTAFRMYNVYGPRQALDNPYQGVLGIFLGNVLRGEPLTIFGDGEQSRDFVYIDDVVDAWVTALDYPATYGQTFNLGSGKRLRIKDLADHVLKAFGMHRDSENVVHRPGRPGEQREVEADASRARLTFGWEPRVSFPEGLAETVKWASTQTAAPVDPAAASGVAAPDGAV